MALLIIAVNVKDSRRGWARTSDAGVMDGREGFEPSLLRKINYGLIPGIRWILPH